MSFDTDIKPLFREQDRTAMFSRFDLWKYDDVVKHSFAIVAAVERRDDAVRRPLGARTRPDVEAVGCGGKPPVVAGGRR